MRHFTDRGFAKETSTASIKYPPVHRASLSDTAESASPMSSQFSSRANLSSLLYISNPPSSSTAIESSVRSKRRTKRKKKKKGVVSPVPVHIQNEFRYSDRKRTSSTFSGQSSERSPLLAHPSTPRNPRVDYDIEESYGNGGCLVPFCIKFRRPSQSKHASTANPRSPVQDLKINPLYAPAHEVQFNPLYMAEKSRQLGSQDRIKLASDQDSSQVGIGARDSRHAGLGSQDIPKSSNPLPPLSGKILSPTSLPSSDPRAKPHKREESETEFLSEMTGLRIDTTTAAPLDDTMSLHVKGYLKPVQSGYFSTSTTMNQSTEDKNKHLGSVFSTTGDGSDFHGTMTTMTMNGSFQLNMSLRNSFVSRGQAEPLSLLLEENPSPSSSSNVHESTSTLDAGAGKYNGLESRASLHYKVNGSELRPHSSRRNSANMLQYPRRLSAPRMSIPTSIQLDSRKQLEGWITEAFNQTVHHEGDEEVNPDLYHVDLKDFDIGQMEVPVIEMVQI